MFVLKLTEAPAPKVKGTVVIVPMFPDKDTPVCAEVI